MKVPFTLDRIVTKTLTNLHTNPDWILFSNREVLQVRDKVWPYFREFALKRKPLPEFETASFDQNQRAAHQYFYDTFTQEKDLCLRTDGNNLTGFVLFDPQSYSLEHVDPLQYVELVIAGTLHGKISENLMAAKKLFAAYENYKGRQIAMNIRREWKNRGFARFCEKLGFKNIEGNAYVFN